MSFEHTFDTSMSYNITIENKRESLEREERNGEHYEGRRDY